MHTLTLQTASGGSINQRMDWVFTLLFYIEQYIIIIIIIMMADRSTLYLYPS